MKRSNFKPALHSFCCARVKHTHNTKKTTTKTSWRLNSRTSKSPNSKKRSLCSIKTATGPSPRKSSVRFNFWSIFPSFRARFFWKKAVNNLVVSDDDDDDGSCAPPLSSRKARPTRKRSSSSSSSLSSSVFSRTETNGNERESTQRSAFPVAFLEVISPL